MANFSPSIQVIVITSVLNPDVGDSYGLLLLTLAKKRPSAPLVNSRFSVSMSVIFRWNHVHDVMFLPPLWLCNPLGSVTSGWPREGPLGTAPDVGQSNQLATCRTSSRPQDPRRFSLFYILTGYGLHRCTQLSKPIQLYSEHLYTSLHINYLNLKIQKTKNSVFSSQITKKKIRSY